MKLVLAVVQRQDAGELLEALTAQGHRVTRISSEGGFLREGNVTLLIACEDRQVDPLIQSVREHCYTRTRYVSPLPPVAESGEFYRLGVRRCSYSAPKTWRACEPRYSSCYMVSASCHVHVLDICREFARIKASPG
jgi:uncharacterized protein YaaQ